jgi:hypothetical protein
VSDRAKVFRVHGDVPLLGPAPEPQPALRVQLTLEFQPDAVPPDRRLAQLLKVVLRRFKARNLGCVEVAAPPQ